VSLIACRLGVPSADGSSRAPRGDSRDVRRVPVGLGSDRERPLGRRQRSYVAAQSLSSRVLSARRYRVSRRSREIRAVEARPVRREVRHGAGPSSGRPGTEPFAPRPSAGSYTALDSWPPPTPATAGECCPPPESPEQLGPIDAECRQKATRVTMTLWVAVRRPSGPWATSTWKVLPGSAPTGTGKVRAKARLSSCVIGPLPSGDRVNSGWRDSS